MYIVMLSFPGLKNWIEFSFRSYLTVVVIWEKMCVICTGLSNKVPQANLFMLQGCFLLLLKWRHFY